MYVYWKLSNLSNVPVGLEVVAATCRSLLFDMTMEFLSVGLYQPKYNNQEIRIQLVGWHYILRWDHAFSYASVAIGSLVDLEQDLFWYIHYTIYCKWNVRLLNACGYDGYQNVILIPDWVQSAVRRSSWSLRSCLHGWLRAGDSARILMFALPFFRVIAEPLSMAAIHQYVGSLVIVL